MKIKWVSGFALISAIGIAIILATASAADRIVEVKQRDSDIGSGAITLLQNAGGSILTGLIPRNLGYLRCEVETSGDVSCVGYDTKTASADTYYTDKASGDVTLYTWDGIEATYRRDFVSLLLTPPQVAALQSAINSIWPSTTFSTVQQFECAKKSTGKHACLLTDIQAKTRAETITLEKEGRGIDRGVVE